VVPGQDDRRGGQGHADAAGKARGAYRRRQFKKKADAATLDAIDDPRVAAMVLFAGIATAAGPMSAAQESAIKDAGRDIGVDDPEDELVFAQWAVADVADLNSLVTRLAKLWTARLDIAERAQLYGLATRIAELDGEPDPINVSALRRLHDRLGLTDKAWS
jgi:uncharacterized tellurite resistance protein B-like protein